MYTIQKCIPMVDSVKQIPIVDVFRIFIKLDHKSLNKF